MERVAVVGASTKPDRYSYKAVQLLQKKGHEPIPVAPGKEQVQGLKAYKAVLEIPGKVDTVTLYVRPSVLKRLADGIISKGPSRVIMNPGTEDEEVRSKFEQAGITVTEACTLVLLSTGQF